MMAARDRGDDRVLKARAQPGWSSGLLNGGPLNSATLTNAIKEGRPDPRVGVERPELRTSVLARDG